MGYSSVYANYTLIRVIDGKVQKERQFTGAEYLAFKKRQFQAYQQTDEYKKELTKLTKKGEDVKMTEEFLFIYDEAYSTRFLLDEF